MTDNTSQGFVSAQDADDKESAGKDSERMPVRLVRGDASPEELAAVLAILASLPAGGADDTAARTSPSSSGVGSSRSLWSSPRRMVRAASPRGPKGWRASARPR